MAEINWTLVVHKYGPLVWRTAWRLVGNYEDAADCFQETFISAVGVARRGRVRSFPALLARLATARALDCLRRRFRRAGRSENLDDWSEIPSSDPGPAAQAEAHELADRLRRALAKLPAAQAEAMCMRALNQMSYRQIAAQLGIRSGTARVMVHRARGRLRDTLGSRAESKGREVQP